MDLPTSFRVATFVVVGSLMVFDLMWVARRPHIPSMREATRWVLLYVGLALVFSAALFAVGGTDQASSFLAGWITEYSLSVDNLFVFVLLLSRFVVPPQDQQKVLMIGIVMSLILRGGFILLGVQIIERFGWVFYFFGAFLIFTAVKLVRSRDDGAVVQVQENLLVRLIRRVLPMSTESDGARLTTKVGSRYSVDATGAGLHRDRDN